MTTMPNFLVIGAAKSGTSSLYKYLGQHPQVYTSPVKEPSFFAFEGEKIDFRAPGAKERIHRRSVTSIGAYRALFEGASGEEAVGEGSPIYLYSEKAADRIKRHVPEARLIVVLRDPAERAYSAFLHLVRNGRETIPDFARALEAEEERIRDNWEWIWHYRNMGFYHAQLARYYERFGRGQIRVYLYEDLKADAAGVMKDLYGFLGVDDTFVPDMSRKYQVTGVPRSRALDTILMKRHPVKSILKPFLPERLRGRIMMGLQSKVLVRPPFPEEARGYLMESYREDTLRLQDLIGRDLSGWLKVG